MLSINEEAGSLNLTDSELYIIYIWVWLWPLQAKMNPWLQVLPYVIYKSDTENILFTTLVLVFLRSPTE